MPVAFCRGKFRRRLMNAAAVVFSAAVVAVVASDVAIRLVSSGRIFNPDKIGSLPACKAGVVLGCSSHLPDGRTNLFFLSRMKAAAELYKSGKVEVLVVSGDNHRADYDEPTDMKAALVKLGVPEEKIACDYAGFRTLDSVVRAREVFGQDRFIVVSQEFHVRRALFIARCRGCDAYGYAANDIECSVAFTTLLREQFAKVAAVLDVVICREPKFLGPREIL